jgi:hypothetical protein
MFILNLPFQNIKWAFNLTPLRNAYVFKKYLSASNDNLQQKIGLRHQKETVQTLINLNILTWKTRMSNSHQLRIFQNAHTYEKYQEREIGFTMKLRKERILAMFVVTYLTAY